jgi:hypothetical protein
LAKSTDKIGVSIETLHTLVAAAEAAADLDATVAKNEFDGRPQIKPGRQPRPRRRDPAGPAADPGGE